MTSNGHIPPVIAYSTGKVWPIYSSRGYNETLKIYYSYYATFIVVKFKLYNLRFRSSSGIPQRITERDALSFSPAFYVPGCVFWIGLEGVTF